MSKNIRIGICQNSEFCKKKIIRMTDVPFVHSKLFQNHRKTLWKSIATFNSLHHVKRYPRLQMLTSVVHLIRPNPHDYWDIISMTPTTSHVVFNSIDLDHMTMRCKYLQCTPKNTFFVLSSAVSGQKNEYKLKNKHIFCTSLIFFGTDFSSWLKIGY